MFGLATPKEPSAPRSNTRFTPKLEALDQRDVPAVITVSDTYSVAAGTLITVDAKNGVLSNDFSSIDFGAVLSASQLGPVQAFRSDGTPTNKALPPNTLTLNPNGSFTFIAPSNLPFNVTTFKFSYLAKNLNNPFEATGTGDVTVVLTQRSNGIVAVGADAGGSPMVRVYDKGTGAQRFNLMAYEEEFTGGVRVAVGDLNQDGYEDIVTIPGEGGSARVKVFSGKDGRVIFDDLNVLADENFRGGGYVAVADITGNGLNEIIVGAGEGGGPRVVAIGFDAFGIGVGNPFTKIADFFAYEDAFRGGVRVAAGDTQGIGRANIITAPGKGGGPVIKSFDYQLLSGNFEDIVAFSDPIPGTALSPTPIPQLSFLASDSFNRDGTFVATGDFRGDGKHDIVTGTGANFAIVQVFNGRNAGLIRQFTAPQDEVPIAGGVPTGPTTFATQVLPSGSLLSPTLAPNSLVGVGGNATVLPGVNRGGARVTTTDWNGDGLADIIVGTGSGNVSRVRVFNTPDNTELTNFLAFPSEFRGGVFVGG